MGEYILELKDIVKTFGGVTALDHVRFALRPGEVHALMGENGAGKSTLVKIITGIHRPDAGEIYINGERVEIGSTVDSMRYGITAIYQNDISFPDLSVVENIFMEEPILTKLHTYNWKEMRKRAKEMLSPFTGTIDVNSSMSALSVAQQQLVAIAKAVSKDAKILIMDEPTSSLSSSECEEMYRIVEDLRDRGISVLLITHKFEDMYRLASHVTVFRDGTYIGDWAINDIGKDDLIEAMVGRKLVQMYPEKTAKIRDEVVLEVRDISSKGYFRDVSFKVRKGEILALTGLVGAGRTEVSQGIYGILPLYKGQIFVEGREVKIRSSTDAISHGIGLLPEDRQEHGLFDRLPIFMSITSASLKKHSVRGAMDRDKEIKHSTQVANQVLLKARSVNDMPTSLSGGNQQKVVLSKLLCCDLKVLILDEPTKGIDVGAKYSIYTIINELAASGYAIVLISSEMPEVLGMADRVIVMKNGMVTGEFTDMCSVTGEDILAAAVRSKRAVREREGEA